MAVMINSRALPVSPPLSEALNRPGSVHLVFDEPTVPIYATTLIHIHLHVHYCWHALHWLDLTEPLQPRIFVGSRALNGCIQKYARDNLNHVKVDNVYAPAGCWDSANDHAM